MVAFVIISTLIIIVSVLATSLKKHEAGHNTNKKKENNQFENQNSETYAVNDVLRLQSKMPLSYEFHDQLCDLIPKLEQKKYKRTTDASAKFPTYEEDERDILFQKLVVEYCENIDPVSDFCLTNSHWTVSTLRTNFWQLMGVFFYSINLPTNADVLYNRITFLWNHVSTEEEAIHLHYEILGAVNNLYVYRDDPEIKEMIYSLCDYDTNNIVSIRRQFDKMGELVPNLCVPTKKAILLEKDARYDEAIQFCDFCTSNNIIDAGYGSFEKRKEHLIKKKAKQMNN